MLLLSTRIVESSVAILSCVLILSAILMSRIWRKPQHKAGWRMVAICAAPVCVISLLKLVLDDRYVYILMLGAAGVVVLAALLALVIWRGRGIQAVCKSIMLYVSSAFLIPLLIFIFDSTVSAWWLLIAPLFLAGYVNRIVKGLARNIIKLEHHAELKKKSAEGLRIAHLSDLHISTEKPLEGELSSRYVCEAARMALEWALGESPDLVVLTGDVTDCGHEAEWEAFERILADLTVDERKRIVVVPGNHDFAITEGARTSRDGCLVTDFDERCLSYLNHVFESRRDQWKVFISGTGELPTRELTIGELLEKTNDYLSLYRKMPPRLGDSLRESASSIGKVFRSLWTSRHPAADTWRGISEFYEYTPPVIVAEELLEEAARDRQVPWPTASLPLVQDLLLVAFPIIVHEDDKYVVVALNSNTCPASSMPEGAIGTLGKVQLNQLEELLKSRENKCTIVLLHHHLGCPPELLTAFKTGELSVLQLEEAQQVCDILASHKPTVVLHGHKHVSYWASYKDVMILSGASVAHGDKRDKQYEPKHDNCHVYNIEVNGMVSLVASKHIASS